MKYSVDAMKAENIEYVRRIQEATIFLEDVLDDSGVGNPKLAICLGSGLGPLANDPEIMRIVKMPYSNIPNFPETGVPGHAGEFILAEYKNVPVILMAGRAHFYEWNGHPEMTPTQAMRHITLPTRVLKALGVEGLVLSNAAGGLKGVTAPRLMLCDSFIDRSGASPLSGLNIDALGPRFSPMGGDECDESLRDCFLHAADDLGTEIEAGHYVMMPGPRYEFTAECLDLQMLGVADAVGMSTVPEVIAALHGYFSKEEYLNATRFLDKTEKEQADALGYKAARRLPVIAVSCITNVIGTDGKNKTNHAEVTQNAGKAALQFVPLVKRVIELHTESQKT